MRASCKAPLTWCDLQANGFFGYNDEGSQKLHVASVIASAVLKGHMREVEVSVTALSHTLALLDVTKPCSRTTRNRNVVYTHKMCWCWMQLHSLSPVWTETHAHSLLSIQWIKGVTELCGGLQCKITGLPSSTFFSSFFSRCIVGVSDKGEKSDV